MKFLRFYQIFSILLLFNIFFINSAVAVPSCCYDPSSPTILSKVSGCDPSQIRVGDLDSTPSLCGSYTSKRQTCVLKSNPTSCSDTVNGEYVFNLPELSSKKTSTSWSNLCGSYNLYDSTNTCGTSNNQNNLGTQNNKPKKSVGDLGISPTTINSPSSNRILQPTSDLLSSTCSNVGGYFGFFVNKNTCENTYDSLGKEKCLYNPHLGGVLSSFYGFSNINPLNPGTMENSCIAKSKINSCFDYKTKTNCQNNLAIGSNVKGIMSGESCNWVENNKFISSFNEKSGICVSNLVSNTKYYNKKYFSGRGNVIKNPSFENGILNWENLKPTNNISSQNSFDGNFYYKLDSNSISQNISNLNGGSSYSTFMYVKYKNSSKDLGININITSYDSLGGIISKISLPTKYLNSILSKDDGAFSKLVFSSKILNSKASKINLQINLVGVGSIDIDAISFEEDNALTGSNSLKSIFKPISIIPASASNCNLCFEGLNFNTCTQKKSDRLGDCSYMVSGPGNPYDLSKFPNFNSDLGIHYYGYGINPYMFNLQSKELDKKLSWKSQSLSNSKLFCELYTNKNQCEDPNNYVNKNIGPLHSSLSGSNLCKWNLVNGCYKDSNSDNSLDLFTFKSSSKSFIQGIRGNLDWMNNPSSYDVPYDQSLFTQFDSLSFNKSCDNIPPSSYIYLNGKNISNGKVIVLKNYTNIIGNLGIYTNFNDMTLDSCKDFSFSKKLFLDIKVNNNYLIKSYDSVNINEFTLLKDLIPNFENLLNKNSQNNLSFIIFDQSGNKGKTFNFTLDKLDLNGPTINLTNIKTISNSNNKFSLNPIGPYSVGSIFNFSIKDRVDFYCNAHLSHSSFNDIPSDFYNNSEILFNSTSLNNKNFIFNVSKMITNSSSLGDYYDLNLNCKDSFDQNTNKTFSFLVDVDTSLLILDPLSFNGNLSSDSTSGFLNSSKLFNAVSTNLGFSNCDFKNFKNLNTGLDILNINSIPTGFNIDKFSDTIFFTNITGDLDFSTQGIQNGSIKCSDNSGNIFIKNLSYYYDSINPIFKSFSLENKIFPDNSNSTYFDGNNYYTIVGGSSTKINLSFTGTGTLVKSIENLSANDKFGVLLNPKNINYDLNNIVINNDLTSLEISNFDKYLLGNALKYEGIKQNFPGFFLKNYSFNFKDSAGNKNLGSINYYYDNSKPVLTFSGDVLSQDNNNLLYVSNSNPNISVSFSGPNYRKYVCYVEAINSFGPYSLDLKTPSNNFSFKLGNIIKNVNVETENISLFFDCSDVYGKSLSGNYKLKFDNVAPILNSISLETGNSKVFRTVDVNKAYSQTIDKIVFDLADTSEVSTTCSYSFAPKDNSIYSCNSTLINKTFSDFGYVKSNDLTIMGKSKNPSADSICLRTNPSFKDKLGNKLANNLALNTKLVLTAQCTDNVGLKSKVKTLDLDFIYTPNDFISFDFKYINGVAYGVVKSLVNYDYIEISKDRLSQSVIYDSIADPVVSEGGEGNIYTYISKTGFDLSSFNEGKNLVYAVSNLRDSYISTNLVVDNTNPLGKLSIPDENFGEIYSNSFWIDMWGEDFNGEIKNVELLLDGNIIFEFNGTNPASFDNNSLSIANNSNLNSFTVSNSIFNGAVEFIGGEIGKNYTFTLNVFDQANNLNQTSKTISIKDGVGIRIKNSKTSIVDISKRFWVTKNIAPTINFSTSKLVDYCIVNPIVDSRWKSILNPMPKLKPAYSGIGGINSFSINLLNDYPNFDLSKLDDGVNPISISCMYKNKLYNYTRNLKIIKSLPDYVLSSSEGFSFNENPYKTVLNIKSVGAYRYLNNCAYSISDNAFIKFPQKNTTSFYKELDFSDPQFGGLTNLKIQCSDIVGNLGPLKTYPILINKNINLNISDLKITNKNTGYISKVSNSNKIYVSDKSNLGLEFSTNKKNNVECNYNLISSSPLAGFFSYVKNLFSNSKEVIDKTLNPYVFKSNNFNLNLDNSRLDITCSVLGTSQSISKSYDISVLSLKTNKVTSWN